MNKTILLIDGTSLAFRAYYAFIKNALINSKGVNTSGPFAFANSLIKLEKLVNPTHVVLTFDAPQKTFRHELFDQYKAQRPAHPPEIYEQIKMIKMLVDGFNLKYLEIAGVEADDVIATLVEKLKHEKDCSILISTQDKDLLQLVSDNVAVLSGMSSKIVKFDREEVKKKFGVFPEQIPDFLALVGDSIDNIPGVPGIGPKTAKSLLSNFKSIEDLYNHLDAVPPKTGALLSQHRDQCFFSKSLVTLKRNVDVDFNLHTFEKCAPNNKKLIPLLKELELNTLLTEFTVKAFVPNIINTQGPDLQMLDGFAFTIFNDNIITSSKDPNSVFKIPIKAAQSTLENKNIKKSTFDSKEEYKRAMEQGIDIKGINFDLKIAAYLIEPERGNFTPERLIIEEMGVKPDNDSEIFASQLVCLVNKSEPRYFDVMREMNLSTLYSNVEIPLAKILASMERRGVKADVEYLKQLNSELELELADMEQRLYELAGEKINFNSPKQISKLLFEKFKLPPVKKTKTGYSTNQETLEKLRTMHPFVEKLLSYREIFKIKSTYVEPFIKLASNKDHRIHPVFHQTLTSTGRLSCSDPNLQNIPIRSSIGKKMRSAIIAEQGYALLSSDYSQIELRLLAHLAEDENMIRAFKEDIDIHARTASLIFNKPAGSITPEERRRAKTVNFGITYGMSPYGLSKELGIPVEEARQIIDNFFASYPKIQQWIDKTEKEAIEKGYVETIFKRRRRIPELKSSNKNIKEQGKRYAINTPVQGSAADIIKKAMVSIYKEIRGRTDIFLILQIHDELLFEVKEDAISEISGMVKEKMENVEKLSVPLKVSIGTGQNWLAAH